MLMAIVEIKNKKITSEVKIQKNQSDSIDFFTLT